MSAPLLTLAMAWRIAFATAAAPVFGAVLLLAIKRLTGAAWEGVGAPARFAPALAPAGALLGLAQLAVPAPDHLAGWMAPWSVALRGVAIGALLAFSAWRLRNGVSTTAAGVTLALVAFAITPVADDWLLGGAPGHPVSAIGMMLAVEAIGAAAAVSLAVGRTTPRTRADMGKLGVTAAIGLAYLAFMDYLITWYGNLPERVGFYVARAEPAGVALCWAALVVGLAGPIAILSLRTSEARHGQAGLAMLAGLLLFNGWWIGGGLLALLLATVVLAGFGVAAYHWGSREAAYG
ncbi:hypothetical protein [Sphingomonas sp.]|uniref:hypothetical protein n=1 Tax=Sphingomonas sp. TaxID=28214 RepID=UPI0035BC1B6B